MKKLLIFLTVIYSTNLVAQVSKVSLQASGLTCSMCSKSIFKSLSTISFVDKIEPNIKTSTFELTFKQNSQLDFNIIKKKVEDAGYAVAKFVVFIKCNNVEVKSDEIVTIANLKFVFVNAGNRSLNGEKQLKIVNKGFIPGKEYQKNSFASASLPDVYKVIM